MNDRNVSFTMKEGDRGLINTEGDVFYMDNDMDEWSQVPKIKPRPIKPKGGGNWDAPPGGDLDDEIPF